jgi:hypothetical protein
MSQIPPSMPPVPPLNAAYGYTQPPVSRSNGAAIGSLICGILGCIPFLTGLLAVILGIVGIRKTRDPAVGGKGLAIAGIILGLISIFAWSGMLGLGGATYWAMRPSRNAAKQFLADVSSGNTKAALDESSGLTEQQIVEGTEQMKPWGAFQDATFFSFNASASNGVATTHLIGSAKFASAAKACQIDLLKQGGTFKVTSFSLTDPGQGFNPNGK